MLCRVVGWHQEPDDEHPAAHAGVANRRCILRCRGANQSESPELNRCAIGLQFWPQSTYVQDMEFLKEVIFPAIVEVFDFGPGRSVSDVFSRF